MTWVRAIYRTLLLAGPLLAFAQHAPQAMAQTDRAAQAWEFSPYRVAVWVAHDNSRLLVAREAGLLSGIEERAELADPSAWFVTARRAPQPWNARLMRSSAKELSVVDLKRDPSLVDVDKLLLVTLRPELGAVRVTACELDLATEMWSAPVPFLADDVNLPATVFQGIRQAFMPVTRIERVQDLQVQVRVRASGIVSVAEPAPDGGYRLQPNTGSPVWIGDEEVLLPVVLRRDRRGNLTDIHSVPWTFLSIDQRDGPFLNCVTHAMRRAPLGGRTGGRTERLALCVRAPHEPSRLQLVSNDGDARPLPDLEVYARRPGMSPDEPSEMLGRTDWRGQILIPQGSRPLRVLFIKSGARALARLPVVPGLQPVLTAQLPDDEQRLYAEGIVRGLQNELMDNVARRQVFQAAIERRLEKGLAGEASDLLRQMREVPDSSEFNLRLSNEEKKIPVDNARERQLITTMFAELRRLSNELLNSAVEAELFRKIQAATSTP